MANNRMLLCCVECLAKEETTPQECFHYIAKYFPSSGWYRQINGEQPSDDRFDQVYLDKLDAFLAEHSHGSLFGETITIIYESLMPGFGQDRTEILQLIQKHITEIQNRGSS